MQNSQTPEQLYGDHIQQKLSRFCTILQATNFDRLIIGSGSEKIQFQDDMAYPFKTNPYFREWVPLNYANYFLCIDAENEKPKLYIQCKQDIWHSSPQPLRDLYAQHLEIIEYSSLEALIKQFSKSARSLVLINETNDFGLDAKAFNPPQILNAIDFQRRSKTAYEHACLREATRLAVPAHLAAKDAFIAGASELEVASTYLKACYCAESEMPYAIIAGINENAAVLHHHQLNNRPVEPQSLLLDAGVQFNHYASDITRTHAYDSGSDFSSMINALDRLQQDLASEAGIGKNPAALHVKSQYAVASILKQFNILKVSAEQAVENKIINTFYPHGLSHHLGCNVHDKGSRLANAQGDQMPISEKYPHLRASAPMVENQIHTVEPGLYFIPALLGKLEASENKNSVNWDQIVHWKKYGGIRIEDNIILHANGHIENVTRDAFNLLN
ncbi:Xaa-Pro dipeptidase [Porticoccaceae bacterium]|nr:Xaa-Pro dipeptidase [Porticoccaceae bacterium]